MDTNIGDNMKIGIFDEMRPSGSGMFHDTYEVIKYLNRLDDTEAFMFDTGREEGGNQYYELITEPWSNAKDMDCFILCFTIPEKLKKLKKPIVFTTHGALEYVLGFDQWEYSLKAGIEGNHFQGAIELIQDYHTICYDKRHYELYKYYDHSDNLHYVQKGVDLEFYRPEGIGFPYSGRPAILFLESLRPTKHPYHGIMAMQHVIKKEKEARLNIIGVPPEQIYFWNKIICISGMWRYIERVYEPVREPVIFIRGCDIGLSLTVGGDIQRTTMEFIACGKPVVTYRTKYNIVPAAFRVDTYNEKGIADAILKICDIYHSKGVQHMINTMRNIAKENFDMAVTSKQIREVCQIAINEGKHLKG